MMAVMAKTGNRRIDRILEPSYLAGLHDAADDRLRDMQEECEEEETVLSYERRLLQGRLEILGAELDRRGKGAPVSSLIERLPEILAGEGSSTHRGSFPKLAAPPVFDPPRRRVEKLVSDDTLARLPERTEGEIRDITGQLEAMEREVSESRRAVQQVLDQVVEETGRRLSGSNGDGSKQ